MISPVPPSDERERLASLAALDVLDTPAEERFDRITRIARALFDVPIALVSLVDGERQWFKSRQGLTACSTSREISFCGHAILDHSALLVEDALDDERFRDNPLVEGPPHIRFYAGQPLRDREGLALGTLCVIDRRPRTLDLGEQLLLADLGRIAEEELVTMQLGRAQLEPERRSPQERRERLDAVTGVWNETGIREILAHGLASCADRELPLTVLRVEIAADQRLTETWTDEGGDIVLSEVAQALRGSVRGYDSLGRLGAQGFLALLSGLRGGEAAERVASFRTRLERNPVLSAIGVRPLLGFATAEPGSDGASLERLLAAASPPTTDASARRLRSA